MGKNNNGFTMIELLVVVVVIGVLASVAFFGYNKVQTDARNSARSTKLASITEALEKYYVKNGEYPGCSAMTQSGSQVSSNVLTGIDPGVLVAPKSPSGTTNSFGCTALTAGSGTDTFAYVGDGSGTCSTGAACLQYTLQYRDENTGTIVSVTSRHQTVAASTVGSTLTATTASNTQVNLSWTAVGNALSYQLQRATDSGFTANLVTSSQNGTTASATGLAAGATYYFRVAPVGSTGQGTWSNTASASTTINAPANPVMTAALVSNNATGTVNALTCETGTSAQYQIQYRSTNTSTNGSWSSWSAWSTTNSLAVAASQGYQYGFEAQARCMGPNIASSTTALSNIPTVVRTIDIPPTPTYLTPASFKSNVYAIVNYASYCPAGTSQYSAQFRSRAWTGSNWGPYSFGYNDVWTNSSGSNKTVEYWGKYQCQTTYSTSAFSAESYNVITVTP